MAIFPTDYTDKTTLVAWDKVWGYDSEAVSNRNFLLSAIKNFVLSWLSTTDVSEWTNLYYTEARVTANTTVTGLGTTKADKSNVLEKDNTTSYTPTANYHPATKLYVDSVAVPTSASDSEVIAWTNTTKFVTPKWLKDTYWVNTFTITTITSPAGSFSSIQYASGTLLNHDSFINIDVPDIAGGGNPNTHWVQYSPDNTAWTTIYSRAYTWTAMTKDRFMIRLPRNYYIRCFQGGTWLTAWDVPVTARFQN